MLELGISPTEAVEAAFYIKKNGDNASDNQKLRPAFGPGGEGAYGSAVKSHLEGIKFGEVQRHRNVAVSIFSEVDEARTTSP